VDVKLTEVAEVAKVAEVDAGTLAPLPQIAWGADSWRHAQVDGNGHLWVGPFDSLNEQHRLVVGRALFRTRKLKQWNINAFDVTVVRKKSSDEDQKNKKALSVFWLRYDGLPVTAAQITELKTYMNLTHVQTVDHRRLEMFDLASIQQSILMTPPQGTNPRHTHGIAQLLALQLGRSILGIAETALRKDTVVINYSYPYSRLLVLPTALFEQRSSQSYRASIATLMKYAHLAQLQQMRQIHNHTNGSNPSPSPKIIALFGKRGADMIAQRVVNVKTPPAVVAESSLTIEAWKYLKDSDLRNADATAVLFGKPLTQKTGIAVALREDVQRAPFMLEVRSRLQQFYDALKRETELPHLRAPLNTIHQNMPLALAPDVVLAFRLDTPPTIPSS